MKIGADVPRQVRELRLIARRRATIEVLDRFDGYIWWAAEFRVGGPREHEGNDPRHKALNDLRDTLSELENAIRAELGLKPIPEQDG